MQGEYKSAAGFVVKQRKLFIAKFISIRLKSALR